MPFPTEIQNALKNYDNHKGFWRRLFHYDQAAIRAIRSLNEVNQTNFLKIYQCFIENLPKTTQESYKVYQTLVDYLDEIDFSAIPEVIKTFYEAQLLREIDLNQLKNLNAQQLKNFASIIAKLSKAQLLTRQNLAYIIFYYGVPEKLDSSESLFNHLMHKDRLNQESLREFTRLLAQLQDKELLTQENIEQVVVLPIDTIQIVTDLIKNFDSNKILIQNNFEDILQQINLPHRINNINEAVKKLNTISRLNEETFSYILENSDIAIHIASALETLNNTGLYTAVNLNQLFNLNNQFLFSSEAYTSVWHPFESYSSKLSCLERQSMFDQIIELSQQENPMEKIKKKMDKELNSELYKNKSRSKMKFFTAPSQHAPFYHQKAHSSFTVYYNPFSRQLSL